MIDIVKTDACVLCRACSTAGRATPKRGISVSFATVSRATAVTVPQAARMSRAPLERRNSMFLRAIYSRCSRLRPP